MVNKRIYFDHAATTKVDDRVVQHMLPFFNEQYGNASSLHQEGMKAYQAVEWSRNQLAQLIHAQPEEIYFTSGGTESDNFAIKGLLRQSKKRHIIISTIEHPAIWKTAQSLTQEGCTLSYLPVDQKGRVKVEELSSMITSDTLLISVMLANNEVGTVQPLHELSQITKNKGIYLHTDAVQAVGNMPVDVNELGVDLMSVSAHKFYGPKGIGALYIKKGLKLQPLLDGGEHEHGKRSGTYNTPGIAGLGKACEIALQEMNEFVPRITSLRDALIKKILHLIPEVYVNGDLKNRLPGNVHVSVPYVEGEALLLRLDDAGFAVSTGSACSAHNLKISHVLKAMNVDVLCAQGSLRISLGRHNTQEEIDAFVSVLSEVVKDLRQLSPLYKASKEGDQHV